MTTAISNDRLKQRFDKWDTDNDGMLQRADFEQEASRIANAFGKPANSAEAKEMRRALVELYNYHVQQAGTRPDEGISDDQFMQVNEKLLESGEQQFNKVLRPTVKALIGMCDDNHDGQINQAEFANWLKGVGVSSSKARLAFQQIDTNNDGQLSEDELLTSMRDFHYGRSDVPLLG